MSLIRSALRAGAATVALAGLCGVALAQGPQTASPQTHVMNLMLPDGGVAHIRYAGDTPPQVYISDEPASVAAAMPALFGPDSPFARMERISAAMDREAARMFREAAALSAQPGPIDAATVAGLPAGAREYQFVSTFNGNGVCSRSVEITAMGNGAAPRVVTHASGDCGAAGNAPVATGQPAAPAPADGPRLIMTKAGGTPAAAPRIQEAALR